MVQEIIHINLNGVNAWLGKQEDAFVLFDTGGPIIMDKVFDNRRTQIVQALSNAGVTPENLKLIVLTHGDFDHTGNAAYLSEKYKAKIAMHPADILLVENPTLENWLKSFQFRSLPLRVVAFLMKTKIARITQKLLNSFERFSPAIFLSDGQDLSEFGFSATVFYLPGHTPGSIGIQTADGSLICGDTFFNSNKPAMAPNADNFKQMTASGERVKSMGVTKVLPGHGAAFVFN